MKSISAEEYASRVAAIRAAADWIEANPSKLVRGALSTDKDKRRAALHAPETECYCALGRIAVEADIIDTRIPGEGDQPLYNELTLYLAPLSINITDIYHANDRYLDSDVLDAPLLVAGYLRIMAKTVAQLGPKGKTRNV